MLTACASTYGGGAQKNAFLASEHEEMERRSRAWADQAVELREAFGCVPQRVVADGSCALASLSIAMGGQASLDDKDALRNTVRGEAVRMLNDVNVRNLLLHIDGNPCMEAGSKSAGLHKSVGQNRTQDEGRSSSPPQSLQDPLLFQGGVMSEGDGQLTDHEFLGRVGLGRDKVAAHVQEVPGQNAMDAIRPIATTVDADTHAAETTEDVGGVVGIEVADGAGAENLGAVNTAHATDAGGGSIAVAAKENVVGSVLSPTFQPRFCKGISTPPLLARALRLESRTYTVHGSQIALAMLRGMKAFENRDSKMRPGWYVVHA